MSEMIERVGAAIDAAIEKAGGWDDGYCESKVVARAAIEAMREPTEAMKQAGFDASPHDVGGCRDQIETDQEWMELAVIDPYQAMIDAALGGYPNEPLDTPSEITPNQPSS